MTIKFTGRTLHQQHEFLPGPALAFEGERVEEYFINAGWAEETDDEPARTYSEDECSVDPETTFGTAGHERLGERVLGE